MIEKKRLLLIMPNFFGYPKEIIKEAEKMGYIVDFYDDRPSTNAFVKAIIRINKNAISTYIKKYYEMIKRETSDIKYDIVFVISGQSLCFEEYMIAELRELQSQAKFVLYQWDSVKNFPYIERMQKYFDKCYSFEKGDSEGRENVEFLPLFYIDKYKKIGEKKNVSIDYEYCFIGTAHPKKYKFISEMVEKLKSQEKEMFIYFFFPSPIVYIYRKICNKELRRAHYRDFNYTSLSADEIDDIWTRSTCILDSPQAGQFGLTIRTLEALGAKRKLITANADVVNYDFYREENIYVYDGSDFNYDSPFFTKEYEEVPCDVYEKYSLSSWLETLFKS